ncbi:FtsQ-type POTRA domain-containing protein [Arenivirga flava]|uniref:FtsQ-type POTRA domain-containing protein n=1 Tax=Arenivirga flava TaxID=1930060 RepID=UPI0024E19015|nr:FtsQ-type POTRA domain-containing protein [Arenivirga flava]
MRPAPASAGTPPTPVEAPEQPRSGWRRASHEGAVGADRAPRRWLERPSADPDDPVAATKALIVEARREERAARREAKQAVKERKAAERGEVRRFTRRSRRRRIGWITAGGIVAGLALLVGVLVVSPVLALRSIEVEGAQRLDPAAIEAALEPQLGTPLALLDGDAVERELGAFPVIESFVTEAVPPSTLVVRIVERQAVLAVPTGAGWDLVDPAGVTVQTVPDRPAEFPEIVVPDGELDSAVFRNAAAVVETLDAELRGRVVRVEATTLDDVTLLLDGVGQTVVWGGPDRPAAKAALLRALMTAEGQDEAVQFDVTAPETTGIVRR